MVGRDELLNAIYEADRLHKLHDAESRAKKGEGRIDVFGLLVDRDIPVIFRPLAIRAALEHDGQPVETAWPYLSTLPADLAKWKPPAKVGALFRRKSKKKGTLFDEVWDAIEDDRPILIGMTISAAFFGPDKDGVVDSNEPQDPDLRHAVLIVATAKRRRKKYVLARNSWGDTWGLSGYAWLSERYMGPRIKVAITID